MAQQQGVSMPGIFGGLTRYDEEYNSKFQISPIAVIVFVVLVLVFVLALNIIKPVVG